MVPSDPREWTDFSDPEGQGFLKVDCDTTLERALVGSAAGAGLIVLLGVVIFFTRDRPAFLTSVRFEVAIPVLAATGILLLFLRGLTDNYFLIDPKQHAIYYHFHFLFIRRVRLLAERQDIVATTVETRYRRTKYRRWWEHRAVLIDASGRVVPMSNWQRDALSESNDVAADLAKQLGCRNYEVADQRRLVVTPGNGRPEVSLEEFTWLTRQGPMKLVVLAIVLAALAASVILMRQR